MKPSEKVPESANAIAELMREAGVPAGVFQVVHGAVEAVTAICDHPDVSAVTFVGSSKIAALLHARCSALHKRVLCMGGAKNHLVRTACVGCVAACVGLTPSFRATRLRCRTATSTWPPATSWRLPADVLASGTCRHPTCDGGSSWRLTGFACAAAWLRQSCSLSATSLS